MFPYQAGVKGGLITFKEGPGDPMAAVCDSDLQNSFFSPKTSAFGVKCLQKAEGRYICRKYPRTQVQFIDPRPAYLNISISSTIPVSTHPTTPFVALAAPRSIPQPYLSLPWVSAMPGTTYVEDYIPDRSAYPPGQA
jgi:hypothetical protein